MNSLGGLGWAIVNLLVRGERAAKETVSSPSSSITPPKTMRVFFQTARPKPQRGEGA
jgi:hypothetical protein